MLSSKVFSLKPKNVRLISNIKLKGKKIIKLLQNSIQKAIARKLTQMWIGYQIVLFVFKPIIQPVHKWIGEIVYNQLIKIYNPRLQYQQQININIPQNGITQLAERNTWSEWIFDGTKYIITTLIPASIFRGITALFGMF